MDGRMDTGGPVRLKGVRPGVGEGEGRRSLVFGQGFPGVSRMLYPVTHTRRIGGGHCIT